MSFSQRLQEIRTGFDRAFWVANGTELFERLAYYGTTAVLAIYLNGQLHFSQELTGWLIGTFGFVVWFLPVLGGTLADRFGFRRALLFAYGVMTIGYFLLGSLSAPWMLPLRHSLTDKWLVFIILMIPALGPSVVKPCVAGTTARASSENVRSIGYSIYYTLVNVGGMLGPIVAFLVRRSAGIENVFRVCSLCVFLMFWVTLFFFREPARLGEQKISSVAEAIRNMLVVLGNFRFVLFLVIFSGFWVIFWQEFISLPLFLRGYIDPNSNVDLLLATDSLAVICFQILVSYLTRKIPSFTAMTLGILVSSLSWLVLALHANSPALAGVLSASARPFGVTEAIHASSPSVVLTLIVLALGEMTLSPRYYEYVSRLAPSGQQGLYMGYAFLPIAIGYFIAGPLGGYLVHHFGDVLRRPQQMWFVVSGIGILTTLLMWIYDKVFQPGQTTASAG